MTGERRNCWRGLSAEKETACMTLSEQSRQPTPTVTHSLIFLRGQSMRFYGHRVLLLTRGPLKNTAVSFPGQKFNTLPIESFPWVFTVRDRKRRIPSKLFSLSIVLLQRLYVKIRKVLRKGLTQELKRLGAGGST